MVLVAANAAQAEDKPPAGNGINPDTLAAYEKIGGKYGSQRYSSAEVFPTFRFDKLPTEKLPAVAVPFGLSLPFYSTKPAIDFKALAHLEKLAALQAFSVPASTKRGNSPITDAWLHDLIGLQNLTVLSLPNADVTDGGMKHVAKLKNLTTLYLSDTMVTPAGLRELAPLRKLCTLRCKVTDEVMLALRDVDLLHALHVAQAKGERGRNPPMTWWNLLSREMPWGSIPELPTGSCRR